MDSNTESLRSSASQWSLAGDKQLLDILQNIHQSLVSRCQEVNRKLDEMVVALDGASVDLQNVNNKFMALSNSQFIESRVYDDDVDIAAQPPPKEVVAPPEPPSSLEGLRASIRVLEDSHDLIEILHSDSEDSDGDVVRTVLKAKDRYGHRPLPYIIGSQAWRNKWHAGLHPEDSDSDSSISKEEEGEQYSDSEPEPDITRSHTHHEIEVSTGSSELVSEDLAVGSASSAGVKPSPSDIAAELARRLGGNPPSNIPDQETYTPLPDPAKKLYRPDQPSAGTVFCDEPPPLDEYQSEEESDNDDIFAELHKKQPYNHSSKEQSRLAEDLFSDLGQGDIFSDFREEKIESTPAKKTILFEDDPEPELFAARPGPGSETKKPVGGISLFGNKKGAESIGAAILKRNQRKSFSDDESDAPASRSQKRDTSPSKNKEKDIFDDLFAKSEREQKKLQKNKEKATVEVKKDTKVDLFSDNLFDDIDDIFTSSVKVVTKEKKEEKPLFDDDEDIFSNVAVSIESKDAKSSSSKKKQSIFDSDDDLFADNVKEISQDLRKTRTSNQFDNTDNVKQQETVSKSNDFRNTRKEFENVDDIFADLAEPKLDESNVVDVVAEETTNTTSNVIDEGIENKKQTKNNDKLDNAKDSLFGTVRKVKENKTTNNNFEKPTKSLFEDEDEEEEKKNDELYSKKTSPSDENSNIVENSLQIPKSDQNSSKLQQKSALFDDDSDDNELFGSSTNKPKLQLNIENNVNIKDSIVNSTKSIIQDNVISSIKENPPNTHKSSIFDDDDDLEDEDVFATSNKSYIPEIINATSNDSDNNYKNDNPIERKEEPSTSDLIFNDDDSYDSNLFSKMPKNSVLEQKPPLIDEKSSFDHANVPEIDETPTIHDKPLITEESKLPNSQKLKQRKPPVKEDKALIDKPNTKDSKIGPIVDDTFINKNNIKPLVNKAPIEKEPIRHESNSPEENLFQPDFIPREKSINNKEIDPEIPDFSFEIKTERDNTTRNEKDALFSEPKDTLLQSPPAIFDDIFSEPPAFEKSAEPKKSKNVNALFDDDSDDEALFFKKCDATLDEKPDVNADSSKEVLFGIFHDEPPAIDVDFAQKAIKSSLNDDFLDYSDSDDDFFTVKSKKESDVAVKTNKIDDEILEPQPQIVDNFKPTPVLDKAEIFEQKAKTEPNATKDTTDSETKKVGKLKTMNLNIDVNRMLPGASPKKKPVEQTDGQTVSTKNTEVVPKEEPEVMAFTQKDKTHLPKPDSIILSTKSNEDLHTKEKIEPAVLKSISFDGEPDSNILDNKLSKERAKIQVKRRPSTRRARKEAVRISAIDLADDSTDNSSSFDEPPRPKSRPKPEKVKPKPKMDEPIEVKTEIEASKPIDNIPIADEILKPQSTNSDIEKTETVNNTRTSDTGISIRKDDSIDTTDSKVNTQKNNTEQINVITKSDEIESTKSNYDIENEQTKRSNSKNVTSKIVYILNDEDIFSNPNIEKHPQKSNVLNIIGDDDDDLFKNIASASKTNPAPSISTLGNAYKEIATNIAREVQSSIDIQSSTDIKIDSHKSLFDKPSQSKNDTKSIFDDEVKTQSKADSKKQDIGSKKVDPKKSLFDDLSDDENELFNPIKKKSSKTKSILDSDSEDDLFGGRKKETKDLTLPISRKEKDVKPKVDVKSSLFGDEDDDLFGVKVKSNVAASPQPTRATREVSKPPEPVLDDPLSLLGGGDD